jgi:hypothetical protein
MHFIIYRVWSKYCNEDDGKIVKLAILVETIHFNNLNDEMNRCMQPALHENGVEVAYLIISFTRLGSGHPYQIELLIELEIITAFKVFIVNGEKGENG